MDSLTIRFAFTPADKRDAMSEDDIEIVHVLLNGEQVYPRASERLLVEFIEALKGEIGRE